MTAAPSAVAQQDWSRHLGASAPADLVARLGAGTIASAAAETARRVPGREAVRVGERALTHGALDDSARRLASWLIAHGAGPGRRVLLAMPNSIEYVVGYLGALHAGAAVAPVNTMFTAAELATLVAGTEPTVALAAGERVTQLRDLGGVEHVVAVDGDGPGDLPAVLASARPADVAATDPAAIAHLAFTSGTTGRAKPTPLSHGNVLASARAVLAAWRWQPDDVLVHALPLQHGHGISGLHTALLSGSRLVVVPAFTPEALCDAVRDEAATVLFGVPTIYERLLAWGGAGAALRGLRLATTGSAGLAPRTSDLLVEVLGQRPLERYGLTETGYLLSNPYDGPRLAGSVGLALPGADVAIVDSAGRPCADGLEGEIVARGPQVFAGYLVDPGGPPAFTPGGWFRTGDMARRDPETGHVHIVGRLKELIITGGLNVYPREVELVLEAVPGVAAAAVVGMPSERWGEEVTAFVVRMPGAGLDSASLSAAAERELAAFKRPKAYHFVPDLPRNQMGKVVRSALVVTVDPKMI